MPNSQSPPTNDDLADLADAILEIARRLAPRGHELREIGSLTGTEVVVLRVLRRSTLISPTDIALATGLTRSNVSAAIRSLEGRGLLERGRKSGDERSVELVATATAIDNLDKVRMIWSERLREVPEEILNRSIGALATLHELADYLSAHPQRGVPSRPSSDA
jgi:DNA-binding MarR family transcriptional regulator